MQEDWYGATQSKLAAHFVTPAKPPASHLRFTAESLSVITTTKTNSNDAKAAITSEINELKKLRKDLTETNISLNQFAIVDPLRCSVPLYQNHE
jgi:hypothetical protein